MNVVPRHFAMTDGFPIPRTISTHHVDGKILLIAPEVPAWLVVDEAEADAITRLNRGASLAEVVQCLISWQIREPKKTLAKLLSRAAMEGFVEAPDRHDERATTIQIHVTNKCNLRCIHCYVSSGEAYPNEVGIDTWIQVIDAAVTIYDRVHVSISGGEPLLVPWVGELLAYAKFRGIKTSMLSNGMLWTDKRINELKPYIDYVNISLDGASEEVHDSVRGAGSFRKAIRGINRLGSAGIDVGINVCLLTSNIQDIERNFGDLVASLSFKPSISFSKLVPEGRALKCSDERPSEESVERVLRTVAIPLMNSGRNPTKRVKRANCGFGNLYAFYANGDVSPCLSPRYIAGNVIAEPVELIFNRILNQASCAEVDRLPLCRTCDLRHLCGGQCHLPQLTQGRDIGQNDCPSSYRLNFYQRLASNKENTKSRIIPILAHR